MKEMSPVFLSNTRVEFIEMDSGAGLLSLGSHLFTVVAGVAKKHSRSPSQALAELCLITNSHDATSIDAWFEEVTSRYAEAKLHYFRDSASLTALHDVEEVLESILPNGCTSVNELPEAFVSIMNLVDYESLQEASVLAFGRAISTLPSSQRIVWSTKAIAHAFVKGPLADSLVPAGWWHEDKAIVIEVNRVALRVLPPTILIEYALPKGRGLRHRRVHLDGVFRESGSVMVLAKKVHHSVAFLGLTVDDLQRYLTRLQKLARGEDADASDVAPPTRAPPTSDEKPTAAVKADIGLLYRDPAAALKNVDLQDADDVVVQEYKNKMDEEFLAKKLKPGDPGYKYDVRKNFNPVAKSEWDDDD